MHQAPSLLVVEQNKFDKAEKTRQKLASLDVCNYYSYIFAGVIGLLVIRNLILQTQHWLIRRRRLRAQTQGQTQAGSVAGSLDYVSSEKGGDVAIQQLGRGARSKPISLKTSDKIDAVLLKPVPSVWPLSQGAGEWTYLRLALVTLILALNIVSCLVVDIVPAPYTTVRANVPRAFARRVGRIATANLPWLYAFAGRNSIIVKLTNVPYQNVRFYHKVVGAVCFVECLVHTLAYTAYYVKFLDVEALHEEYSELYFKMGIVAVVGGLVAVLVALRPIRTRAYELFLAFHIVGAALMLAGSWYHRPIMEPWVYAAAAVWAFERAVRLVAHVMRFCHSRLVVRRPLVKAEATLQDGAIKLAVPFGVGSWKAGQHVYVSFWGTDLLRRPWLYGQAHPFSIANMPELTMDAQTGQQKLQLVLRVKRGITLELARLVERMSTEHGSCHLLVSVEGPYGSSPRSEEYDSLILVTGGSGITHVASVLEDACLRAEKGETGTTAVKLVWAVRHLSQAHWMGAALMKARARAASSGLALDIRIFVTRPAEQPVAELSKTDEISPAQSPEMDEKKDNLLDQSQSAQAIAELGHATISHARPDLAHEVASAVAQSNGHTLLIACGPDALAEEVRAATGSLQSSAVTVQIARFEC